MLRRNLVGNFFEEDSVDFGYNWLPKCFRHFSM